MNRRIQPSGHTGPWVMIALLAALLTLGVCVAAGDVSMVDLEPTLRMTLATR